ncbi:hypothetical protein SAMD00019534_030740, partial [Acytostelium subglobosum LB1]|uniref:hypothetical protein n=1 Tax=Acytostelium subglobosum LB1 TaxID=1410327 RepID=UPI0006451248
IERGRMKAFQKLMGSSTKSHKIGGYQLNVVKQIAEGGFSYVYLVKDANTGKQFALKRILVRDNEELANVKHEIDIMQLVKHHKNIVKFIDYNHSKSTNEVFILMELCSGGHLVDLMMKRQQNRFTEVEVLGIFSDVCESVAAMHSLNPPIIHRDLKVENVLLDEDTGLYKLCDFGSAIQEVVHLNNKTDIQNAEDDISKHTTIQYRPPEMVDLYRAKVLDEKVDIWALGCLLYKLLYYTTPFEEAGSLGIINGNYIIPPSNYSNELVALIRYMLHPEAASRPDIYYITNEVCRMRGVSPLFPGKGQYSNNPYMSSTSPTLATSKGSSEALGGSSKLATSIGPTGLSTSGAPQQRPKPLPHTPQQAVVPQSAPAPTQQQTSPQQTNDGFEQFDNEPWPQQQHQPSAQVIKRRHQHQQVANINTQTASYSPAVYSSSPGGINTTNAPPSLNIDPQIVDELATMISIATSSDPIVDLEAFARTKEIAETLLPGGKGVMKELVKRPLREPVVCLKSLMVVHKLMIESTQSFKNDAYDMKDLFNNLYLGWSKQKEKLLLVSDYLSYYSLLIHKLVLFHNKYYLVDGMFSFDESKWTLPDSTDSINHPIRYAICVSYHSFQLTNTSSINSVSCINNLASILDQVLQTQQSISEVAMSTTSLAFIPLSLLQQCVNILNSVSFSIYCFISGAISTLLQLPDAEKLAPVIAKFQTIFQTLKDQYSRLSALPPFATEVFFPTLPKNPPNYLQTLQAHQSNNQQQQVHHQQQHVSTHHRTTSTSSNNPFDTPTMEPSFNPFATSASDPFNDVFAMSPSPHQSPRVGYPQVQQVPILSTNSPSLPQSPVSQRRALGYNINNSFDQMSISSNTTNPFSPSPSLSPHIMPSQPLPPQHKLQHSSSQSSIGQHYSPTFTSNNPFDATPQQQQQQQQHSLPHTPKMVPTTGNNLMVPPTVGNMRGHRRSQSTADELRRRQQLQQQIDQSKEFMQNQRRQNNQRATLSTSINFEVQQQPREVSLGEHYQDDFDDDDFGDESETSSIMSTSSSSKK